MTDRYEFLKTIMRDGKAIALMIDKEAVDESGQVIGEGGAASIRNSFNAHASDRIRSGVLPFTALEIQRKLKELKDSTEARPKSIAAFERAAVCVVARASGVNPPPIEKTQPRTAVASAR